VREALLALRSELHDMPASAVPSTV